MRLTNPAPFALESSSQYQISFRGQRGELLRLTALEHEIFRVECLPEGKYRLDRTWSIVAGAPDTVLEGRKRENLDGYSLPEAKPGQQADRWVMETDTLKLVIDPKTGALFWSDRRTGHQFAADLPARPYLYDRAGRSIFHYMSQRSDEHYYGFGEPSGVLDKRNASIRLQNVDAPFYNAEISQPLYKHIPFYITYIPEYDLAYGMFYDNLSATTFEMGREVNGTFGGAYHYYHAEDGDLDLYFVYGRSIEQVVERYTWLTGRPALLPDHALGYLGSTMSYTEAPDAQAQLAKFSELCRQHDIPCDLFHLSSGYTTSREGKRYVFNWNHDRVPDPARMVTTFQAAGIHVAPNIKPHLLRSHPKFDEVASRDGFITDPDTGEPGYNRFWSGGMFEAENGALLDFTDPATYDWWKAQVKAQLLDYGMDAIWNDNNEFELWDDDAILDGFGAPFRLGLGGRGVSTLLMGRASYEALAEHNPDRLPFVLSRAGVPGIQRYAQTWSGDNTTSWETMKWNQPMGLNLGLSGVPHTGHDIGGFLGPAPEPELFLRWLQVGAFYPRFAIHSWNDNGTVSEPWMYPEILPLVRDVIHFRYQLKPMLTILMREAHETGHPIMRPLVYHYADDPRCRTESFDFMFGADMLIAPVLEAGITHREVYLPTGKHGAKWIDFYTGEKHDGGKLINAPTPIEHIPVFVRAGAVIELIQEGRTIKREFPRD